MTTTPVETTDSTTGGPQDAPPVLRAHGITMRFGGLVAVNNVDFQVHDQEIVGLIGPNGAGKTTFFNCLTGMYRPTRGRVTYRGRRLPPQPRLVARAGVARTFQNIRLFGNMTALENVMVGRYCRTRSGVLTSIVRGPRYRREERETLDRSRELLSFVGLSAVGNSLARNLSYGDQRRLEIARALATDPGLLLLDEPTAGMNPQETGQATDLIFAIRERGLGVVVIEHDMRFIFRLCDRITCLVRGEVLVEGTAEQVQSDERVIEAYLGTGPTQDDKADGSGEAAT
ncbi:MAG: ATP-binding cassette domain-containing protein [Streptosporangiales bacterium]|nr:ATP-binding cassette domain-containing protein [Streptosporangiales bacterium]